MDRVGRLTFVALAVLGTAACSETGDPLEADLAVAADPNGAILFLALPERPRAVMEALYVGTVVLDHAGCFRLGSTLGSERPTVVWPYGSTLVRRGGDLVVVDEHGVDIGVIGGELRFGGGEVPSLGTGFATEAMRIAAEARCPGRYWIVGDVVR